MLYVYFRDKSTDVSENDDMLCVYFRDKSSEDGNSFKNFCVLGNQSRTEFKYGFKFLVFQTEKWMRLNNGVRKCSLNVQLSTPR